MRIYFPVLLAAMIAATFATRVAAMPDGTPVATVPGAYPMDCEKWQDKARCAAFNQKIPVCRDKTDDAWLDCMYGPTPAASFTPPRPRDCSQALNKEVCAAHVRALEACKEERTRAEHRACVATRLQTALLKGN